MPFKYTFKLDVDNDSNYVSISRSGYGRIDDTSTIDGLSAHGFTSCAAIIGHCAQLKRIVLIHTPAYVDVKRTLQHIFDWLVAKNEEKYSTGNSIQVAILRGKARDEQTRDILAKAFESLMKELSDFFKDAYGEHSVHIDGNRKMFSSCQSSALVVDKGTALITILRKPKNILSSRIYSIHQNAFETFVNDIFPYMLARENEKIVRKRHLQFDIDKFTLHSRISDHCRLFLRAKLRFKYSDKQMIKMVTSLNIRISKEVMQYLNCALSHLQSENLPCEVCPLEGSKKCSNCMGAWYCGRQHQREDWNEHKRFCKLYPAPMPK